MSPKVEAATLVQLEAASLEAFGLTTGSAFLAPAQPAPGDKDNCGPKRQAEKPKDDFALGICWRIWAHFLTPAKEL